MADLFDVLADGTRRDLLTRLLERSRGDGGVRGMSVSELVADLGVSQPTVSKHLKVLRDQALVSVREEGQHRFYRLETDAFAGLQDWLAPFVAASDARFDPRTDAASGAFAAWAGPEVAGQRLGRTAADAASAARAALGAAQERLQGATQRARTRLPWPPKTP